MLCYKDRNYCGNIEHELDCDRQITDAEFEDAKRIELPIAYMNYCKN